MRLLDRLLKPTVDRLVAACIEEERVDALYRYRAENAMVSWDEAVTRLLKEAGE